MGEFSFGSGLGNLFTSLFGGGATTPSMQNQTLGFGQDNILDTSPGINTDAVIGTDLMGNKGVFNLGDKMLKSGSVVAGVGPKGGIYGEQPTFGPLLNGEKGIGVNWDGKNIIPGTNFNKVFGQGNYWKNKGNNPLGGLGSLFSGENILKGIAMLQAKKNDKKKWNAYDIAANNDSKKDNNKYARNEKVAESMYGTSNNGFKNERMEYVNS